MTTSNVVITSGCQQTTVDIDFLPSPNVAINYESHGPRSRSRSVPGGSSPPLPDRRCRHLQWYLQHAVQISSSNHRTSVYSSATGRLSCMCCHVTLLLRGDGDDQWWQRVWRRRQPGRCVLSLLRTITTTAACCCCYGNCSVSCSQCERYRPITNSKHVSAHTVDRHLLYALRRCISTMSTVQLYERLICDTTDPIDVSSLAVTSAVSTDRRTDRRAAGNQRDTRRAAQ